MGMSVASPRDVAVHIMAAALKNRGALSLKILPNLSYVCYLFEELS